MSEQSEATDEQVMRLQRWLEGKGWQASIEWKKSYFRQAKPKWGAHVVVRRSKLGHTFGLARLEGLPTPPSIEDLRKLAGRAMANHDKDLEERLASTPGENE